jgi:hypothetical protein
LCHRNLRERLSITRRSRWPRPAALLLGLEHVGPATPSWTLANLQAIRCQIATTMQTDIAVAEGIVDS